MIPFWCRHIWGSLCPVGGPWTLDPTYFLGFGPIKRQGASVKLNYWCTNLLFPKGYTQKCWRDPLDCFHHFVSIFLS